MAFLLYQLLIMSALKTNARFLPLLSLMPLIVVVDQMTKIVAQHVLPYGRPVEIWGDIIRFSLIQNPAIAFSLGRNIQVGIQRPLFIILPVLAIIFILIFYIRNSDLSRSQQWCIAAITGGGIANCVDRFFRPGGVVDFIDVKFYGIFGLERYPTFNIADSSIVVAGLLLVYTLVRNEFSSNRKRTFE